MAKSTQIAVNDVLANLETVVAADTSAIIGDLELLTRINNAAQVRYSSMAEATKGLENDNAELNKYTKQVDEIDQRVGDLENLVQELGEWCSELEVKIKHAASVRR